MEEVSKYTRIPSSILAHTKDLVVTFTAMTSITFLEHSYQNMLMLHNIATFNNIELQHDEITQDMSFTVDNDLPIKAKSSILAHQS